MAKVGSLVIDLIAETASFNANMQKASATLNSEASKMRRSLETVEQRLNLLVTASKAVIASQIVGEFQRISAAALDYASSLGEAAQQIGVTTDDLQTFRYAATQVGVSQEEMDKGLAKLTKTLGSAQLGAKGASEVFEALGVKLTDSNGRFRSTGEVIPEIADALAKISDPARRAAIEVELFGKAGQKLDTLLAGGSGAIDELKQSAMELGYVISSEQIQKADDAADKLAALKAVMEARIAGAVADNIGIIMKMANAVGNLINLLGKAGKVIDDFGNKRNVRGLFLAGDKGAATNLLTSQGGRTALLNETDRRIQANMTARANGQGNAEQLDREFRALNRIRNTTLRVNRNAAKPAVSSDAPESLGIDNLLASSGKSGGSTKVSKAADDAARLKKEAAEAARELQSLFDELTGKYDPSSSKLGEAGADVINIDKLREQGLLSDDRASKMQVRAGLGYEIGGEGDPIQQFVSDWQDAQDRIREGEQASNEVAQNFKLSWQDAADGALSSLNQLSSGLKNGDFLDILGGVIDLLMQLGSIGAFGGGVQTNIRGARAGGGPVSGGGTYLVGEKGPELFTPSSGGMIISNDNLRGLSQREGSRQVAYGNARADRLAGMERRTVIEIQPSPMFSPVVRGEAAAVAAPMATQAGVAGAGLAESRIRRKSRNTIPN